MKISELMTRNVHTVTPITSIKDTIDLMRKENIGFIVITERQIPVGVITDRDLLMVVNKEINLQTQITKVMKKYVITINENCDVIDASDLMGYSQVRRLVVINDEGFLVGVISVSDLIKNVYTEEYGYAAITEISYDFSTTFNKCDSILQISAYKI